MAEWQRANMHRSRTLKLKRFYGIQQSLMSLILTAVTCQNVIYTTNPWWWISETKINKQSIFTLKHIFASLLWTEFILVFAFSRKSHTACCHCHTRLSIAVCARCWVWSVLQSCPNPTWLACWRHKLYQCAALDTSISNQQFNSYSEVLTAKKMAGKYKFCTFSIIYKYTSTYLLYTYINTQYYYNIIHSSCG